MMLTICQKRSQAQTRMFHFIASAVFTLSSSIQLGSEKMVQMLIQNGADVSIVNDEKETALMLAAMGGKTSQLFNYYQYM